MTPAGAGAITAEERRARLAERARRLAERIGSHWQPGDTSPGAAAASSAAAAGCRQRMASGSPVEAPLPAEFELLSAGDPMFCGELTPAPGKHMHPAAPAGGGGSAGTPPPAAAAGQTAASLRRRPASRRCSGGLRPEPCAGVPRPPPWALSAAPTPSSASNAPRPATPATPARFAGGGGHVHLRVEVGKMRFLSAGPLAGMRLVFKLGPTQEVSAWAASFATADFGRSSSAAAMIQEGTFGSVAISSDPVWQLDPAGNDLSVEGPRPARLYLQLWRGPQLLALAKVPLAHLDGVAVHTLAAEDSRALSLLDEEVPLLSAAATTPEEGGAGAPIGSLHITLHAGCAASLTHGHFRANAPAGCDTSMNPASAMHASCPADAAWETALALGSFRMAASDMDCEDIMHAAVAASPLLGASRALPMDGLFAALLRCVPALSEPEAAALAMQAAGAGAFQLEAAKCWRAAVCACPAVEERLALRSLLAAKARAEAAVDRILREVGTASSAVVAALEELGEHGSLRPAEFSNLLRGLGMRSPWELLRATFESLAGPAHERSELPAVALARLMRRRAEDKYREAARAHEIRNEIADQLRALYSLPRLAELLDSYASTDGHIDRLPLAVALKEALDAGTPPGGAGPALSRDQVDVAAESLIRLLATDGEPRVSILSILEWIEDADGLLAAPSMRPRPPPISVSSSACGPLPPLSTALLGQASRPPTPPRPQATTRDRDPQRPPAEDAQAAAHPEVQIVLQMLFPLSETALRSGFERLCAECLAQAVAIAPARIRFLSARAGSPTLRLQLSPGPRNELTPPACLKEIAAQLCDDSSPLRTGPIGNYLAGARLLGDAGSGAKPLGGAGPSGPPPAKPAAPPAPGTGNVGAAEDRCGGACAMRKAPAAHEVLERLARRLQVGDCTWARAVARLDVAAQTACCRHPDLWRAASARAPSASIIARLVDEDCTGVAAALSAWEDLDVPAPHPGAAVEALLFVAAPAAADPRAGVAAPLRVTEASLRQSLKRFVPQAQALCCAEAQKRIFEVICASGLDLTRAFDVLDKNRDGMVSLSDFTTALQDLGGPISQADLAMAAHAVARGEHISATQFVEQYTAWFRSEAPSGPVLPGTIQLQAPVDPAARVEAEASAPFPGSECLELPSFLVFAFLDQEGRGQVSTTTMRAFARHCLGLRDEEAARVVAQCDLAGRGCVTYKDFRKYFDHMELQRAAHQSPAERKWVDRLRRGVRVVLELADEDAANGAGDRVGASTSSLTAAALERRGRNLESAAAQQALQELLVDLRLPAEVSRPLLRGRSIIARALLLGSQGPATVAAVANLPNSQPSFSALLQQLRRARCLLRSHLDSLYGACVAANLNLLDTFQAALRSETQSITVEGLIERLQQHGVGADSFSPSDVLLALDPHCRGVIFVPELVQGFVGFRARYSTLLGALANQMSGRGITPDELFATRFARTTYPGAVSRG